MKQLITVKIQSFVDVITNSSTELFVADTNNDVEVVLSILQEIITKYNNLYDTNYDMSMFGIVKKFKFNDYINWLLSKKNEDHINDELFDNVNGWFTFKYNNELYLDVLRKDLIVYGGYKLKNDFLHEKFIEDCGYKHGLNPKCDEYLNNIIKDIKNDDLDKPYWWDEPYNYNYYRAVEVSELDGKIMILGAYDNSIPYDIWDIINTKLNAQNYHLG